VQVEAVRKVLVEPDLLLLLADSESPARSPAVRAPGPIDSVQATDRKRC